MSNSWRALAKMARDLIVASDPEDLSRILDLWSLRLSALARLRLTNQASAECDNLFAVLNAVPISTAALGAGGSSTLHSPIPMSPVGVHAQFALPSPAGTHASLPPSTPTRRFSPLPTYAQASHLHLQPHSHSHAQVAVHPAHAPDMLSAYPFELSVLRARVRYWAGDVKGYIDMLAGLLVGCKANARMEGKRVRELKGVIAARKTGEKSQQDVEKEVDSNEDGDEDEGSVQKEGDKNEDGEEEEDEDEDGKVEVEDQNQETEQKTPEEDIDETDETLTTAEANLSMWLERAARVCLMIASQLVEMKDYHAAIKLLEPLCMQRLSPSPSGPLTASHSIHSAVGRVHLLSGNLQKAAEHFGIVASCVDAGESTVAMNTALMCSATGDWSHAEAALKKVLEHDPQNYTATNNLAVTLLAQGRVKDGIELLESAMRESPASVLVAEPFIFNLSTLYELRSSTAMDNKRELLVEVARWSGDGLKATCLKMPPN
ncbi:hypothetical protein V8B97DRAFT_1044209 [Scleroderma yunnanense]